MGQTTLSVQDILNMITTDSSGDGEVDSIKVCDPDGNNINA
ncbi:unnamed protein product [marine sediment metagenome]|uniref:Uncharacterized protein n=1 Tax=marine sediment metagenome TaxID=412755 RepID=X0VK28_9ZZZZ